MRPLLLRQTHPARKTIHSSTGGGPPEDAQDISMLIDEHHPEWLLKYARNHAGRVCQSYQSGDTLHDLEAQIVIMPVAEHRNIVWAAFLFINVAL